MMLKIIILHILLLPHFLLSQVGINTTTPHSSAIIDIDTGKIKGGLLIPRINLSSTLDVNTVPNPATGLLVYNMQNNGTGNTQVYSNYLYYYVDNQWKRLTSDTDLITNNDSLPYVVAFGRKTTKTRCLTSDPKEGIFNLDVLSDSSIISSSGEFTAPKEGYYSFSVSMTWVMPGAPAQIFAQSPYIRAQNLTTYTTRFRGTGVQWQPRTTTGVVYLLQNQKTAPFYWNIGSNTCTTSPTTGNFSDNTPHIRNQEVVWEYVGN